MPELRVPFTGRTVLIVLILMGMRLGLRIVTMIDMRGNQELMRLLNEEIKTHYLPDDVRRMEEQLTAGNQEGLSRSAQSLETTVIKFESVQCLFPLFQFSSGEQEVPVRVEYAIKNDKGVRKQGVNYYLFEHPTMGNTWRFVLNYDAFRYYLRYL